MPDPVPFPPEDVEGSLHGRFARVAAIRASALAIAQGSVRLTYEEVDRRSDALAAAIARSAPAHLAAVVILVADPIATILSALATWKAGKLCVPLNPDHPPAYLGAIVRDTEAALVVTDRDRIDGDGAWPPRLRVDEVDLLERVEPPRPSIR